MRKSVTCARARMHDKTSKQYSLGQYDPFLQSVCTIQRGVEFCPRFVMILSSIDCLFPQRLSSLLCFISSLNNSTKQTLYRRGNRDFRKKSVRCPRICCCYSVRQTWDMHPWISVFWGALPLGLSDSKCWPQHLRHIARATGSLLPKV